MYEYMTIYSVFSLRTYMHHLWNALLRGTNLKMLHGACEMHLAMLCLPPEANVCHCNTISTASLYHYQLVVCKCMYFQLYFERRPY